MLIWDATCWDTLAPYDRLRKVNQSQNYLKSANTENTKTYWTFSVETLRVWCSEANRFVDKLGKMISEATGEKNSKIY